MYNLTVKKDKVTHIDLAVIDALTYSKQVGLLAVLSFHKNNKWHLSKRDLMRRAGLAESNFNRAVETINQTTGLNIELSEGQVNGAVLHQKGNKAFVSVPTHLVLHASKYKINGATLKVLAYLSAVKNWNGNMVTMLNRLNSTNKLKGISSITYLECRNAIIKLESMRLITKVTGNMNDKITGRWRGYTNIKLNESRAMELFNTNQELNWDIKIIETSKQSIEVIENDDGSDELKWKDIFDEMGDL